MKEKWFSLRLWPNGEFGIGIVRKYQEPKMVKGGHPEPPSVISWTKGEIYAYVASLVARGYRWEHIKDMLPSCHLHTLEASAPLGLSNASNSHKRAERGSKGVSSFGRRMIRNGAFILEKAVGRRKVAMLTATIPPLPIEVYKSVTREWSEIVRVFIQGIVRRLRLAHGYSWVIGCVEIQEQRLENEGGLPLHLHIVFQSRTKREFTCNLHEVSRLWQRAICSRVPDAASVNYSSATRIEAINKSVANYLSKYISKGINQNVLVSVGEGFKLPSAWWIAAGGVKQEIKRRTMYETGETATKMWWMCHRHPNFFTYTYKIEVGEKLGACCVGISGRMPDTLAALCRCRDEESIQILLDS